MRKRPLSPVLSSAKHPRFLDLLHAGVVDPAAIGDFIHDWQEDPDTRVELHVYLGLTWSEYLRWRAVGHLPGEVEHCRLPTTDHTRVGFGEAATLLACHGPVRCRPPCPVHWPSKHPLAGRPKLWDDGAGIMKRLCAHGVEHPDPDDSQVRLHPELTEHDCDGCCTPVVVVDGEFREQDRAVNEILAAYHAARRKGITGRPS